MKKKFLNGLKLLRILEEKLWRLKDYVFMVVFGFCLFLVGFIDFSVIFVKFKNIYRDFVKCWVLMEVCEVYWWI